MAAQAGYTLPVFATAGAIAALRCLQDPLQPPRCVTLDLLEPPTAADIPIEQVAQLGPTMALAITRSDPGDNLDLTRDTPIWALVTLAPDDQIEAIALSGGEGVGQQIDADRQPAIYAYARRLLLANLTPLLQPNQKIHVTIILPQGRSLALRTSNAAFGVVDGLALLGTSGIAHPLSAPDQLDVFRHQLRQKAVDHPALVFCVGENGLDRAAALGINPDCLVKTANWLGPLLVEAALMGVRSLLLFGYHGKLMKLAGGVFHTHHHVADGRQEIFAACAAEQGLPLEHVQKLLSSPTAEAGLAHLRQLDIDTGSHWTDRIYGAIAHRIDRRSAAYVQAHSDRAVAVGSILFGRDRQIIISSQIGSAILPQVLLS